MTRRATIAALAALVACGGPVKSVEPTPSPPAPPEVASTVVRIELAWLISDAPTELELVQCKLVLRVIGETEAVHEVGSWWREQAVQIEIVPPASIDGPVFHRTAASIGEQGELTTKPQFEVSQDETGRAVIVRGRDDDTGWQELLRVPIPDGARVKANAPSR